MARSSSFQYRFETLRSSIAGMAASEEVNKEPIVPSMHFDAADEQRHEPEHEQGDPEELQCGLDLIGAVLGGLRAGLCLIPGGEYPSPGATRTTGAGDATGEGAGECQRTESSGTKRIWSAST